MSVSIFCYGHDILCSKSKETGRVLNYDIIFLKVDLLVDSPF
jgi:hypothetical protein